MVTHYKTLGLVFWKEDRFEADREFTLFTPDMGKIDLMGRGIRKIASKLRGGIELFSLSEVEFISSQHRNTLVQANKLKKFSGIADNPEKIIIAQKVSRLVSQFIIGQESDSRIWELLVDFFSVLDGWATDGRHPDIAYSYFFWNFVAVLGYSPELYRCASCDGSLDPVSLYFSQPEGGVLCPRCSKGQSHCKPIHQDIVKILRIIIHRDWKMALKLKIEPVHREGLMWACDYYYSHLQSSALK